MISEWHCPFFWFGRLIKVYGKGLDIMLVRLDRIITQWARRFSRLSGRQRALLFAFLYLLTFVAVSFITRLPMLITGRSIVWHYDSSGEYYPATVYFVRAIREFLGGQGFSQYDFSIGLGDDAISSLNFYGFGDPILFLLALTPINNPEMLFTLGVYLRQLLAGAFCYLYLREMDARRGQALVGALAFSFCAFVNGNTVRHQNFLNVAVYMPLILMGFEFVFKGRNPLLLMVSVALLALSTYYFLFMASLFLLVYALLRFFSTDAPKTRLHSFAPLLGRSIMAYLTGVCLSGIILLPAVYGFLHSARIPEPLSINLFIRTAREYLSMLPRYIFPVEAHFETVALWSFFGAIALVSGREAHHRKFNYCILALVLFYLLSPLPAYLFNGLSYVSQRSVFILSLMSSLALVRAVEHMSRLSRTRLWAMTIITALLFVAFAASILVKKDMSQKRAYYLYIAGLGVMAACILCLLWRMNRPTLRVGRWGAIAIAFMVICGNLGANGILLAYWRYQGGQLVRSGQVDQTVRSSPGSLMETPDSDEFYRVEMPADELSVRNESLVFEYPATACYLSVQNQDNLNELKGLEDSARVALHYTNGFDGRARLLSVMGVRYFAAGRESKSRAPYGYRPVRSDARYTLYQSDQTLPLGYSTDRYIPLTQYNSLDGLGREQALMLGAVLSDTQGLDLTLAPYADARVSIPYRIANLNGVTCQDGVIDVMHAGATMSLSFASQAGCETYLRLGGLNIDDAPYDITCIEISGDGFDKDVYPCANDYQYHYGQDNYLVNLGFTDDPLTSLTLRFTDAGRMTFDELALFCLPIDGFTGAVERMSQHPLTQLKRSHDKIEGKVSFDQDRVLVFSIPYSEGWTARVDDAPHKIDRGHGLTMSLPLRKGEHRIELTYNNPWSKPGLMLSTLGLGLLASSGWHHAVSKKSVPRNVKHLPLP